jgi:hypothetical protein
LAEYQKFSEVKMDVLTQQLLQQLAGGGLSTISQKLGVDEKTVGTALSIGMPMLVSALANNASKPAGAQSLQKALTKDHDGSILNDVAGYLNDPQAANGAGILGHILGTQQPAVNQGLAQSTGLSSEQVAQLLQIAAPLVMGALGAQQQQKALDPAGLTNFLGTQQQKVQSNPNLMNTLNSLLDLNGDGSAIDDVIGIAGKLLSKK